MIKRLLFVLALAGLAACGTATATGTDPPSHKVFVCKYVGTPGDDERLQTGDNPISVDTNSLRNFERIGDFFNDAQGRSIAIAYDTGQPEPSPDECPKPPTPTTTTVKATTTTTEATTTTTTCPDCTPNTQGVTTSTGATTTSPTTGPPTTPSSSSPTTTVPGTTTTAPPGATTTTTLPPTFSFSGASTVCISEVPTIRITFGNTFPELDGRTGTLTMAALDGTVVSTQPLVYAPGTTVDLLYPGTRVNSDGSIADVPGWNLNAAGFWVRDPSDEFLRDGIVLTFTVNPTATATVTYPPESSACANPDGPFPPGTTPPPPGTPTPPPVSPGPLPPTR